MTGKTFRIAALVAAVVVAGVMGSTVVADDDSGDGGFLRHLHEMIAQRLHGGGHSGHGGGHGGHHDACHRERMADFVERLELTPEQLARFEKIHEILGARYDGAISMAELHDRLVTQVEEGRVDAGEVRAAIDEHVEHIRARAYAVTDEMIALVDELDASQRETLLTHLRGCEDRHDDQHGH